MLQPSLVVHDHCSAVHPRSNSDRLAMTNGWLTLMRSFQFSLDSIPTRENLFDQERESAYQRNLACKLARFLHPRHVTLRKQGYLAELPPARFRML